MNVDRPIPFPCERFPEDARTLRLLGLYDMCVPGLVLQRIKVHAGRLTPAQLRGCAELARKYTPGYPLHLTTRQDIELHGLKPDDVPAVQRGLRDIGLTAVGAAGDTPRNVTTCPGCGLCPGTVDVADVADTIKSSTESLPWIRNLPRKFKVSISGCGSGCARPWINDIGLIAGKNGAFRAILAGSLGARPGTGTLLYESLAPEELVPLAVAALRLFNEEGDRQNRSRARLRHVRERLGDAAFAEKFDALFRDEKKNGTWPVPQVSTVENRSVPKTRLRLPLGDIEPDTAVRLADAVERANAVLRIGLEHDLLVYGDLGSERPPELGALTNGPSIVSCPGSTWCEKGIANSRDAAARIRDALPGSCDLKICLSGCPNNCAHAAVADIGFTGRMKTIDGVKTECFRLVAGGGKGRNDALAEELHPAVPAGQVPSLVAWLTEQYAAQREGEREPFSAFVARTKSTLSRTIEELIDNGGPGPVTK